VALLNGSALSPPQRLRFSRCISGACARRLGDDAPNR
jgi:hypothetical protein